MTTAYPILERRDLAPVPARGPFGLGRRSRDEDEIPKADAHQVLVYLTEGGLVADHGQLRLDDERVVRARHVSLVDMGRDVPVTIELQIPSAEASDFAVEVTFACTVTDAIRAVRENLDAQSALRHYLLNHRRIFQLGLPYKTMQISQVRIDVGAQITAYTTLRPPVISGLEVTMTSVQVHTPEELTAFERKRREQLMDHMVSYEGIDLAHRREDLQQAHQRDAELDNQQHAQTIQARAQAGRQELERDQSRFARDEAEAAYAAIGNAHEALIFAHARGQITAKELSELMRADEAAQAQYAKELAEQARLDTRRESEFDRAERRRAEQTRREEEKEGREYRRQLAAEQLADRRRREQETREDRQREIEYRRKVEEGLLARQLEVLRQLRESGQLEMVDINVERIIADVLGVPVDEIRPPAVSGRADPALPSEASARDETSAGAGAEDDVVDVDVREEDDR